jgi:hypothetical protein
MKTLPLMWVLWSYVDMYQREGVDFPGSQTNLEVQ